MTEGTKLLADFFSRATLRRTVLVAREFWDQLRVRLLILNFQIFRYKRYEFDFGFLQHLNCNLAYLVPMRIGACLRRLSDNSLDSSLDDHTSASTANRLSNDLNCPIK
jgi:hypothetical protein